MGYTHYWWRERELDAETFKKAVADCREVCQAARVPLAGAQGKPGTKARFSASEMGFNGVGDAAHETFLVQRSFREEFEQPDATGRLFDFTKTARKPYDLAVCACFVVFRHFFGRKFRIESDGNVTDAGWSAALDLCQRVLGYGKDFRLDR